MSEGLSTATNRSIDFFERQFRQQIGDRDFKLNPFEVDLRDCRIDGDFDIFQPGSYCLLA